MMSKRLYYTDAYQTEFDAQMTAVTTVNGQPALVLDQSCFYPSSGGQPYDIGTLNGKPVVDVIAGEQGEVYHVLSEALPEAQVGQVVHGVIDWERRYDHMQQHAGQHLLSQIFYQHFGFETASVHFGATESTLDLETPEITPAQIAEAETAAMTLVYAALPINAYFVSDSEIATIPLRRPPKVSGEVRIVEIEHFDYSACGGTHCRSTAEIGPIKLIRVERRRGQVRLTFLCGKRAWCDYQHKHILITEAANLFSNEISQVPTLIERNANQLKAFQRQIDDLQEALLAVEATQLLATATRLGPYRLVKQVFTDKDAPTVKRLAAQLQQQQQVICLLGSIQEEKATVIFARAADVALHSGQLLRECLQTVGGKGGGKEELAQGGGITRQQAETVLAFAEGRLQAQVSPR
ncbi:MAG: DHHA1 domain-containing protein [Caldilineaceae bacterium]